MTLQEISSLGRWLSKLLDSRSECFASKAGRLLALLYVQGLLSAESRKNVEALALRSGLAPRTLQRFLESIKWDDRLLEDNCQRIVAKQHADAEAIGLIDETGVAKNGSKMTCVQRQYNGNRGKVENAVVHVGIAYSTGAFHALLDARVYLPEEWASDLPRRKKLRAGRRGFTNEAGDRLGFGAPRPGEWRSRQRVAVRRAVRSLRALPG